MAQTDFNLDENNNLQFLNGDFYIENCDNQNVKLIIQYQPGHLKSDPKLGVGIDKMLLGQLTPSFRKLINRELNNEGYTVKSLTTDSSGNLQIKI